MNTSSEAARQLEQAHEGLLTAIKTIQDLIARHEYQDEAALLAQAAAALTQASLLLMQSDSDGAFDAIDQAEDLLDQVYGIIDGETDEE